MTPSDILSFWFEQLTPKNWWQKDPALDQAIKDRFSNIHSEARAGALWHWRTAEHGRLAEIIILDQFSRNMYRDTPQAFSCDPMALVLAQEAVAAGVGRGFDDWNWRAFLVMPYMHSESAAVHAEAVRVMTEYDIPDTLEFELKHKAIIDRFGRYPHRNAILGRESTAEERAFLLELGSGF